MKYGMRRSLRYIPNNSSVYECLASLSLAFYSHSRDEPIVFCPSAPQESRKSEMSIGLRLRMAASRGKGRSLTGCIVLLGGPCRRGGRCTDQARFGGCTVNYPRLSEYCIVGPHRLWACFDIYMYLSVRRSDTFIGCSAAFRN